ncbi:MAG: superoxide dismutase [Coleofasciculus sp. S288]|nr:superoxide dismutase [Coleofasciculus sp. S288]
MAYELPDLPYAYDALDPYISAKTFEFHHDKHHAAYVTNYNKMVEDAGMADKSIEEVIKATYNDSSKSGLFNNGAQAWNHTFFWNSMKPGGGGAPTGAVADKINSDLGGYDKFKEDFKKAAATQFGSGWAWLVLDNGTLKIANSPNAVNPIALGQTPLLTLDVWEHAYYLDYQNKRPDFIDAFINNLINWDFVNQNMAAA